MKNFKSFITEGRPSQQHPLEGHDYHQKTDAQLEYIAKDAHKAAEAMKGHNTTAENKYRDQANDSATVRYWRKKHGMPDWYKKKYGHMKEETEQVDEAGRCWPGHKPVPGKKPYSPGSCQKEEVEQIDELSKNTLGSYVKKATRDARLKHGMGKDFERISKSSRKPEYKAGAKEWEDKYKSDSRKREAGIGKAVDRLTKEEVEQVDEIHRSCSKTLTTSRS